MTYNVFGVCEVLSEAKGLDKSTAHRSRTHRVM